MMLEIGMSRANENENVAEREIPSFFWWVPFVVDDVGLGEGCNLSGQHSHSFISFPFPSFCLLLWSSMSTSRHFYAGLRTFLAAIASAGVQCPCLSVININIRRLRLVFSVWWPTSVQLMPYR